MAAVSVKRSIANSSIEQTKKNEHGKCLREFKAGQISLNKVRDIKSREFKAERK